MDQMILNNAVDFEEKKTRVAILSKFVDEFEINCCLFTQKLNMHNIKKRRNTNKIFRLFRIEQDYQNWKQKVY